MGSVLPRGVAYTNNYCEAAMRVLKDKVLLRTKAFNALQLVDFVITRQENFYERRLIDVANNRLDNVRHSKYLYLSKKSIEVTKHSKYIFPPQVNPKRMTLTR